MTLRIATTNADGMMPAAQASMIQAINGVGQVAAASALQTANLIPDQYQNCAAIIANNLNQVVTIGAGFFTTTGTLSTSSLVVPVASTVGLEEGMRANGAGVVLNTTITSIVVGVSITLSELPTAGGSGVTLTIGPGGGVQVGTALTGSGIAVPTIGSFAHTTIATTATSTSATVASATGFVNGYVIGAVDANTGGEVITPGTTYTISGTTVTLSAPALLSETAAYCCSVQWVPLGGQVHP